MEEIDKQVYFFSFCTKKEQELSFVTKKILLYYFWYEIKRGQFYGAIINYS